MFGEGSIWESVGSSLFFEKRCGLGARKLHVACLPPNYFCRAELCSGVSKVLDSDAFTLEDLLLEDEIIQEAQSQNTKLIEL